VTAETDRGEPPKVINPKPGCRFRARCPLAVDICSEVTPELRVLGPRHSAACHVATSDGPTAGGALVGGTERNEQDVKE
jgi:hypothetical protein